MEWKLKRLKEIFKNSSVLILSCLVTIFLVELAVRLFVPQDRKITWLEMATEGYMMNQAGGSTIHELDTLSVQYTFNSNRLRGEEISEDAVNVLGIGDSFTFGLYLDEEDTYIHSLQEKADEYYPDSIQFLNGGIGGSGLADWPLWLESIGSQFRVDYLVYFMNYDDVNRALSKNLFVYKSPDSLVNSQRWKPKRSLKNITKKNWYRWFQQHSDLANIIVKVLWKYAYFDDITSNFDSNSSEVPIPSLNDFDVSSGYSTQLSYGIINKMSSWCELNECEFIIINTGFFEEETMSVYDHNFYDSVINSELSDKEIYFDNSSCVSNGFTVSLDDLRIPGDSHPNARGAKAIAECSWNILVNKLGNQ